MDTKKSFTVKEATVKLMQFCAYRDRTHKEVEEKLKSMNMIPEAQQQIIMQLMQDLKPIIFQLFMKFLKKNGSRLQKLQ